MKSHFLHEIFNFSFPLYQLKVSKLIPDLLACSRNMNKYCNTPKKYFSYPQSRFPFFLIFLPPILIFQPDHLYFVFWSLWTEWRLDIIIEYKSIMIYDQHVESFISYKWLIIHFSVRPSSVIMKIIFSYIFSRSWLRKILLQVPQWIHILAIMIGNCKSYNVSFHIR